MADLKNAIKQSADLNDEYIVHVDKYVNINVLMNNMNITDYKIKKRKDSEVYDVSFYKNLKLVETRKAIFKGNDLHVARYATPKTMSFYQVYLVFSLFGR
jgi:hypothetical protein